MAVNLIDSNDITITQDGSDIELNVVKDNAVSTSSTKPVENQAITNYVNSRAPIIDTGITEPFTTINGFVDKTITFTKTFTQPPILFLSLDGFSTNTNYEHITFMYDSVTTTGATIRVLSSFANLYPSISWVAIGV